MMSSSWALWARVTDAGGWFQSGAASHSGWLRRARSTNVTWGALAAAARSRMWLKLEMRWGVRQSAGGHAVEHPASGLKSIESTHN